MVSEAAKRTTISILKPTKDALDSIKHPGQTYDGMIQELIWFWKREHRVEEIKQPLEMAVEGSESKVS